MRAITKLSLLSLLIVGLLAAPLAIASGPGSGEDHAAAGQARGDEHRQNATAAGDDHRAERSSNASAAGARSESDRANMTAARLSWRENASAIRESWLENASAIREGCHGDLDRANATREQQTAWAQCVKTGYQSWREANFARLQALRDAFLALFGKRADA